MKKSKPNYKDIATANFLLIMEEVIGTRQCKNRGEFAKSVGEYLPNISIMEKGERAPTLEQCGRACDLYGYNMNWLVMNKGEKKFDPKQSEPITERVSRLEQQILIINRELKKKR
ncbi:MAG TPA: hypothetical protein VF487_20225 [Chitinophagaceae bacterium]